MRPSKLKTPLAVLRSMLTDGEVETSKRNTKTGDFERVRVPAPLSVERVAEWLGCSPQNVQSIESRRGTLTLEKAELISRQTGINIGWLAGDEPTKPPVDWGQNPYTQETFNRQQAELKRRQQDRAFAAHLVQVNLAKGTAILAATLLRAFQDGNDDVAALRVIDTLRGLYCNVDKTGTDRNGLVGSYLACRHKKNRPDLKPILDIWEAHFQNMLPQRPQPKAPPAKPTGKAAKRKPQPKPVPRA